jgi:spore coat protein A, manganese oxidase
MDRRKFIKIMGAGAVLAAIPWRFSLKRGFRANSAWAFAQSPGLTKFVDPLPGLGPGGIPVAAPDGKPSPFGATHYSISIGQFKQVLHSDFVTSGKPAYISGFAGTTLWGYADSVNGLVSGKPNFRHLGGLITTKRAAAVQITFTNTLSGLSSPLPVDRSSFFPDTDPSNKTAVHLHGGLVPWISDGGPFDWWGPDGSHGPSFLNGPGSVLDPNHLLATNQAEYYYPNNQSARLQWYHDHAHDLTRINAYAGVATGYLIVDDEEQKLIKKGILPNPLGAPYDYGVPLIIQDKIFVSQDTASVDPTWENVVPDPSPGNLWYAHVYDPDRWALDTTVPNFQPPPDPSCIPEFFGDTMLMNGHVYPFMEVPPKRVRFRLLNACNARFVNLQLWVDDGSPDGITMKPADPANGINGMVADSVAPGPKIIQIGTEGGFLPGPVVLNNGGPGGRPVQAPFVGFEVVDPSQPFNLLLAPAERADFIIDFNGFQGQNIILYTDAPAPFPAGDPLNDYFPGSGNPTPTNPGFGPNTRQIMQFRVGSGSGDKVGFKDWFKALQNALQPVFNATQPKLIVNGATVKSGVPVLPKKVPVRTLTLNEGSDSWGRLIQTIGTDQITDAGPPPYYGKFYADQPTEIIQAGATEVWQIYNLTGDTHPIHTHLVNWQILARQPFSGDTLGNLQMTGPARPPDPNEMGWKETVRMNPNEVIWVTAKYDLPPVPFAVPQSPRLQDSYQISNGNEFVYHCHILEHEEHDMMRPLVITGKNPQSKKPKK